MKTRKLSTQYQTRSLLRRITNNLERILAGFILTGSSVFSPSTGPDSKNLVSMLPKQQEKIFFVSDRDKNDEIYMMNPDGSRQENLTNNPAVDLCPAVSPDGQWMAFVSNRNGDRGVYKMHLKTKQVTRVTEHEHASFPSWSPDGESIAYTKIEFPKGEGKIKASDIHSYVMVVNADGTGLRKLTHEGYHSSPSWSPDGNRMAIVQKKKENPQICIMNSDGSNISELTDGSATDTNPAWSPDGKRIAFMSFRSGFFSDIYFINPDGTGMRRLFQNQDLKGNNTDPSWSYNGDWIVYAYRLNDRESHIYKTNVNNKTTKRLTDNPSTDILPVFGLIEGN